MKILVDVLPEKPRQIIYYLYALAGLIFGAWAVVEQPDWLTNALAVYAFVGTALGLTAGSNTAIDPFKGVEIDTSEDPFTDAD